MYDDASNLESISLFAMSDPSPPSNDYEELLAEANLSLRSFHPIKERWASVPDDGAITFQRCGGGRRVIRKRVGTY